MNRDDMRISCVYFFDIFDFNGYVFFLRRFLKPTELNIRV
jgi:hypothetical protein